MLALGHELDSWALAEGAEFGSISPGTVDAVRIVVLRARLACLLFGAGLLVACSSQGGLGSSGEFHESDPASSESTGTTSAALSTVTRSQSIALAEQWVTAKLQYCQSANGAHDYDTACSSVCHRTSDVDWDPYRSDCSGFISWAWELPAPGRVTSEFAPFDTTVSTTVKCVDMKPGDAANKDAGGHIVLFKEWVTPGSKAVFIEEPGCSSATPYAHEFTSSVTCSGTDVDIAYEGETFTAIRYIHMSDDAEETDAGSFDKDGGPAKKPSEGQASSGQTTADGGDPGNPLGDAPALDSGCSIARSPTGDSAFGGMLAFVALALVRRRRTQNR